MKNIKKRLELEQRLRAKPHSYQQLADVLNLDYDPVARYVKKLRDADLAHVQQWLQGTDGRYTVPLIAWGKGKDAMRPPADTAAQRMARTRANRRAAAC